MHTRARVDSVVDRPVVTLPTIRQRAGNLFKAWIQREVVADRILFI